ncbi:MAG: hypothetical protein EI684_23485 [Candidatus Viridilinea halotolerans]|uniref:Pyrrolo-quinoline quinone repeat domain-containing protein n=1 Tax=Candidatus Viridilinea halotolerans TaxID=2491704 RepID=A0A426TQ53_9CHLR|nr:MAG: hypothetical protein EI684_23485 [Candidatus Viridilinea halotolerans]
MENRVNQWRMLWTWNGPTASGGPDADHVRLFDSVVPIVGAGRLYVGDDAGNVRAINATNGTEVWVRNVGGRILDAGAYDPTTQAVFFASTNGILYKLRADTGAIMGQLNTGSSIEGAVLLVGNRVYVGNAAGRLIAVNTTDMSQAWSYNASAALYASSAYSAASDGMIIFPAEDGSVHAVRAADGSRAWRTQINSFPRPERRNQLGEIIRPERRFPDVYPVVAEQAGVVIMRSYFDWELTWTPTGGAFADQEQTRQHIAQDRRYESLFVLELSTGQPRFTAPVMGGAMGNGNYYYSSPPQATVRRLANGTDVAYVLWRNRDVCRLSAAHCDGREDTTFGEMNLTTGSIRFIQDYKNEGTIRFPTDEQGPLSMVGNVLFHGHWMSMGSIYIADRATGGESYNNPIPSQEYLSVTNTMAANQCNQRNAAERFCPVWHTPPGDGQSLDPGFYLYTHNEPVYDLYWHPPTRGPIFDNGVLYWRSSDGAIVALAPR